MEFAGLAISLVAIVYLSAKKHPFSRTMFVAAVIVALTSSLPAGEVLRTVAGALIDRATLELAATVFAIGVFAAVMSHLGFLDRMSSSLQDAFNPKAVTALVPALIGAMPVLGGAQVSAPLVDKTGDSLGLDNVGKAAANLIFRHGMFFVFPFSPSLILLSQIAGVRIWDLISRLWPASALLWASGYVILLKPGRDLGPKSDKSPVPALTDSTAEEVCSRAGNPEAVPSFRSRSRAFADFLFYGSPLVLALAVSIGFGIPLWGGLSAGSLVACVLGWWKRRIVPPLDKVLRNPSMPQVPAMFFIMVFRAFIASSQALTSLAGIIGGSGGRLGLFALLVPFLFGFISANHSTSLGVLVPVFIPALGGASEAVKLSALSSVYITSFLAYLTSPLHLCQILTSRYFGVTEVDLYRRYWPTLVGPAVLALIYAAHVTASL